MPIHASFGWVFGAQFPQIMSLIILTPNRTVLGWNHVIWAIKREYWPRGSSWALKEEKKGQDRTGKKVTKRLYFTYLGRSPTQAICIKNRVVCNLLDVITCAKFQNEIFRGYNFTVGRIFDFPIDIWMGLTTVQRYWAACDNTHTYIYRAEISKWIAGTLNLPTYLRPRSPHGAREPANRCSKVHLQYTTITPPQPFYGPFSGTTQVRRCQKRTSGLYGARED